MKKILLFSLFIFLTNCGTCDHCDDSPVQYEYTIKNISGVKIEIIPHKINSSGIDEILLSKRITIEDSKSYTEKYSDGAPYDGYSFRDLLKNPSRIDIIFNDSKKIIFEECAYNGSCSDPRNIFNYDYNNETTETYTITIDDYQNAIDCNGNCF